MSDKPLIYMVTKQQVGGEDVNNYLRRALEKEFGETDYMISTETLIDTRTHYSTTPRKLKGFALLVENKRVTIYFDITDVTTIDKNSGSWKTYQ